MTFPRLLSCAANPVMCRPKLCCFGDPAQHHQCVLITQLSEAEVVYCMCISAPTGSCSRSSWCKRDSHT